MTILESRLMSALADNEYGSEINLLKSKIKELEGVVRSQDEVIYHLNEENASFKSRLLALEKIVLNMSQDNSNNDGKLINAISIEENLPSHDFTQITNLNENVPMAQCANKKNSSGTNKQSTEQMINITDRGAIRETNEALPVLNNIAETLVECQKNLVKIISKKINETDRSDNPTEISEANKHHLTNEKTNSALGQKHLVPCPFLCRRGHCLKGSKCDFSHQLNFQQPDSFHPQQNASTSIARRISYPFQRFQPTTSYPIPHPYTNFPSFYRLPPMETHATPPPQLAPPPSYPVFHPFPNFTRFYPPPLMEIPTRPPPPPVPHSLR